ncbi:MAG TPA: choice-of-anchor tandem repeat GloVer-containing protein [Verrucomicrobiae bacterium]|nr:choice-of-anchor tandem repeat GloVer-containing protein [Verrucomicrobiae bacterium]
MNPYHRLSCLFLFCVFVTVRGLAGEIVLHSFSALNINNGTNQDGAYPAAGLALSGGVLCGTTVDGGSQGAGTAFYMAPDASSFKAFRSFANTPDAANPQGDLVVSGNNLFGTAFGGGASSVGTVFIVQTNGVISRIHDFAAVNADNATNAAGASPDAAVTLSPSGNILFGTASAGGFFANGVIFSANTNGTASSVLHTFSVLDSNTGTNTDGAIPLEGLAISGGTLYGTASAGGAGGNGTVFSVGTNGSNFVTLYSFTATDPVTGTNTDGAVPSGGLILANGVLYGTTMAGGFGEDGVIFSIATNGSNFTVLHQFTSVDAVTRTNADGAKPVANLLLAGGTLYGTAPAGGSGASGSVFSVGTNGSQFQTLYNFSAVNPGNGTNADGAIPDGDLVLTGTSLYGTTFAGGFGAAGTVFSVSLPLLPATVTGIIINPDGSATLSFLGSPNSTNVVQSTADLTSGLWQNISTNTADPITGIWNFTDTTASQLPVQFYRSYSR